MLLIKSINEFLKFDSLMSVSMIEKGIKFYTFNFVKMKIAFWKFIPGEYIRNI